MKGSCVIDPLSCVSVLVGPLIQHLGCEEIKCGPATAFVVQSNGKHFLVTNYHVVSERRSTNNISICKDCGFPTHLKCYFHGRTLGTWEPKTLRLYSGDNDPSSDKPLWSVEQLQDSMFLYADVVVLPLLEFDDVKWYPAVIDDELQIATNPCSKIAVI